MFICLYWFFFFFFLYISLVFKVSNMLVWFHMLYLCLLQLAKCDFYGLFTKDAYTYSSMRAHVFKHAYPWLSMRMQTEPRFGQNFLLYLINCISHVAWFCLTCFRLFKYIYLLSIFYLVNLAMLGLIWYYSLSVYFIFFPFFLLIIFVLLLFNVFPFLL